MEKTLRPRGTCAKKTIWVRVDCNEGFLNGHGTLLTPLGLVSSQLASRESRVRAGAVAKNRVRTWSAQQTRCVSALKKIR